MGAENYDVIVVGARCSGAPLALHLARSGARVLVLDADALPSDQPFSTHAIQPLGMRYLDELGVGDSVRRVTPPVRLARLDVSGVILDMDFPSGLEMYCPRRSVLDRMLQEALGPAGVDVRDRTAVVDIVKDGDRVVGVRAKTKGAVEELRARVVVGADGRNSTIARLVGAEEYNTGTAPRAGYWAYWRKPELFDRDARFPYQTVICIEGADAAFCFQSDGDLLLMGSLTLPQVARGWAKDPARHLVERLSKHRVLGPLVQGPPATKPVGLMKLKTFFRRAAGPGWALVGDAGLHKDPTPGLGITDALRDARSLAEAILEGTDPAFERYWRLRDVQSVPLFRMAEDMGSLEYDNAMTRLVFRHVNRSPALKERMRRVTMRELQAQELVSPGRVLGWMALELLRGRFDVVAGFLRSGKRAAALEKEMRAVQDALARLEAVAGAAASAPV